MQRPVGKWLDPALGEIADVALAALSTSCTIARLQNASRVKGQANPGRGPATSVGECRVRGEAMESDSQFVAHAISVENSLLLAIRPKAVD